jgi:exodeoxyribonuclease III
VPSGAYPARKRCEWSVSPTIDDCSTATYTWLESGCRTPSVINNGIRLPSSLAAAESQAWNRPQAAQRHARMAGSADAPGIVEHPGGWRCGRITARLLKCDADVIVIQETVSTRGPDLCHQFATAGYEYRFSAPRGPRERGLCLLSRLPIRRARKPLPRHAGLYPRGWLEVELVASGWHIAAVYAPAEGPLIPAFWNAAAEWVACRGHPPLIMLGDFNAGMSGVDAEAYRFRAGQAFARLADRGLVDLWRREHGARQEFTWFSRPQRGATGRGFRIDHAFASSQLAELVTDCRYDHQVRKRGLSDHSLLLVDLRAGGAATVRKHAEA